MKKLILALIIALSLLRGCATMKVSDKYLSPTNGVPRMVIIGGAGSTDEQLDPLRQSLFKAKVIIPRVYYPLWAAVADVIEQMKELKIEGPIVVAGWSWGALIAHEMNGKYPGLVVAIGAIASPLDIAFVPSFLGAPFNPDDDGSQVPLYVIAGVKPGVPKKWYMTSSDSDGIVDIDAAKAVGNRNLKGFIVVRGEDCSHFKIPQNAEAVRQMAEWLNPFVATTYDNNPQVLLVKNEENLP